MLLAPLPFSQDVVIPATMEGAVLDQAPGAWADLIRDWTSLSHGAETVLSQTYFKLWIVSQQCASLFCAPLL
jgi:hypothetical protein